MANEKNPRPSVSPAEGEVKIGGVRKIYLEEIKNYPEPVLNRLQNPKLYVNSLMLPDRSDYEAEIEIYMNYGGPKIFIASIPFWTAKRDYFDVKLEPTIGTEIVGWSEKPSKVLAYYSDVYICHRGKYIYFRRREYEKTAWQKYKVPAVDLKEIISKIF